jgi:hypothetical protein
MPKVTYEPDRISYTVEHHYTPDFKVKENVYIETKGLFRASDRAKHLHIKEQHPEIKIYFIFQNPNLKLNKVSKTTYAMWAEEHGYEWTTLERGIPAEWLK